MLIDSSPEKDLASQTWISFWTSLSSMSLVVSLTASAAGAANIASQRSTLTAGVMIALALVPSASISAWASRRGAQPSLGRRSSLGHRRGLRDPGWRGNVPSQTHDAEGQACDRRLVSAQKPVRLSGVTREVRNPHPTSTWNHMNETARPWAACSASAMCEAGQIVTRVPCCSWSRRTRWRRSPGPNDGSRRWWPRASWRFWQRL